MVGRSSLETFRPSSFILSTSVVVLLPRLSAVRSLYLMA